MKFGHQKTISEYNTLLQNLNPTGKYQLRIYAICIMYWTIAGIYTGCFQLAYKNFICTYALGLCQAFGILLVGWIANLKGRKFACVVAVLFGVVGFGLLLGCVLGEGANGEIGTFGIAIIGLAIYSQPFLSLGIICELTTLRIIQNVLCLSLIGFCIGRMAVVPAFQAIDSGQFNTDKLITIYVIAPCCLVSILLCLPLNDSPRYFIQTNIPRAQLLIKYITLVNTGKECEPMHQIDQNFIIKRIHLRKYNYLTLTKFSSFGFQQYTLAVVIGLLGVVGSQAKYIFMQNGTMIREGLQIVWVCFFQIIGVLASAFFLKFCNRKLTCALCSLLISIYATVLYCLPEQTYQNLVLLGLNAVFSIVLFTFLLINCIQFYPHSVRSLGFAFMLSLYYTGQVGFSIYQFFGPTNRDVLQLFLIGSWIMFLHCGGLRETLEEGLGYQIKQIQQQQNEDI